MAYNVTIEVTYKYLVDKEISAKSKAEAKGKVEEFFKNFDRRVLEDEWIFGDEPDYIGDLKIVEIEKI